ncbi:PocR ligand-binding domain-containing protein [Anaerolineales bacterium HSG6]|nr:PocR ligand-binding domain-containing protein [Anaerolineales bacterium HSG6]
MDELLTTKQIIDLLKIDRTTVYRMLNDGRLEGVKIGGQWRFKRQNIKTLISESPTSPTKNPPSSNEEVTSLNIDILPLTYIQSIQDVFAEIAQVSAITTTLEGVPLTKMSNKTSFCKVIRDTELGRQGCINSWCKLAQQTNKPFATCFAGLQYAHARIELEDTQPILLFMGQIFIEPPTPAERQAHVHRIAEAYSLDEEELIQLSKELSVLDERMQHKIGGWLKKIANLFEQIGQERVDMKKRLQRIAALSRFEVP